MFEQARLPRIECVAMLLGLAMVLATPALFAQQFDLAVYSELRYRHIGPEGNRVIAIASQGDTRIGDLADDVIHVPDVEEFLQPIVTSIPLQLLAYHIAVLRGCDVDKPRNLAKSVTVE